MRTIGRWALAAGCFGFAMSARADGLLPLQSPELASDGRVTFRLRNPGAREALLDLETPGAHTWQVWRRNLAAFLPLLFR